MCLTATRRLLLATTCAALLSACAPTTVCDPDTRALTGNLAQDVLGTWDSFGIDSPVYRQLRPDGILITVEALNNYAPEGWRGESSWRVEGTHLFFDEQDLGEPELTETTLVFPTNPDSRTHRRVQCRGFGFEDQE